MIQLLSFTCFLLLSFSSIAEVRVNDDWGRAISLSQPAERIIALSPSLTENLFYLGVGDRMVGVSAYSNYPAEALDLPSVGDAYRVDMEQILALQPDLIFVWAAATSERQLAEFERYGIPVFVEDSATLRSLPELWRRIAILSGKSDAEEQIGAFEHQLDQLYSRYKRESKVVVFFQLMGQPLRTLNGTQTISSIIELCGGVNPFADQPATVPQIDPEAVLVARPEIILTGDPKQAVAFWRNWSDLPAVSKAQIYPIDGDKVQRLTARTLEGTEVICEQIARARD